MTDGQFYTFVGLGVVGIIMIYDVAFRVSKVIGQLHVNRTDLTAIHHSICSLHTAFETGNTEMQSRVYDAATEAGRASGLLGELVQPIRDQKRRQEQARYGIYDD